MTASVWWHRAETRSSGQPTMVSLPPGILAFKGTELGLRCLSGRQSTELLGPCPQRLLHPRPTPVWLVPGRDTRHRGHAYVDDMLICELLTLLK